MKKIVVISGGSDGLGRAIAEKLQQSHTIIILARNEQKLKKTATALRCEYVVCDITKAEEVEHAVKTIDEKYHRVDVLINNAGVWTEGALETNTYEHIKHVFEVNTIGTIFLTKVIIPLMKKQKNGLIINIISQAGMYAKANRSVYHASKWALSGFTKCLERELSPHHIGVTGVYPGKLKTGMFEKTGISKNMADALPPTNVAAIIEFLLSLETDALIPEIGVKRIDQY